jgi:capsule polysaccharide export protein KpsC/LpsZ
MADWITRSVQYLAARKDIQLVIRVHPGEILTHGPSMVDVVRKSLPEIPENIHLVLPTDKTNTYDLIEMADLGLVYTTTTGMEMAMSGVPVIVAGFTHYRSRGFTHDPNNYEEYFNKLDELLKDPAKTRLSVEQTEQAWHYAYCFFFEYAIPFPWRVVDMWKDLKERPIPYVLGEGMGKYRNTFRYLTGDPIEW